MHETNDIDPNDLGKEVKNEASIQINVNRTVIAPCNLTSVSIQI